MAVPALVVSNAEIAAFVPDVDEGWILQRTGIDERRIAADGESTTTLATAAATRALARAGVDASDVDLVIVATCTPDRMIPATAPSVQCAIGATRAGAFDMNAACAGFLTGLATADAFVRSGAVECVVVVGAETLSRFVDWTDRKTCVLFGDGAGAVVVQPSDGPAGLLALELGADGSGAELIQIPAGGSANPTSPVTLAAREHTIRMNGPEVYRAAVRTMADTVARALVRAGLTPADVDQVILHQANERIIEEVRIRLGIPADRVFSNVARYGNTSAASVPIALCEAADAGILHEGSRVALGAIGAGLTWCAGVLRWTAATGARSRDLVGTGATTA